MPIGHLLSRASDLLVKRAAELSGGKIKITHHPGGTLFIDKEAPEAVMSGACGMAIGNAAWVGGHDPAMHIFTTAMIVETEEQWEKFIAGMTDLVNEVLEPKGFKVLGWAYYGDANGFGNIVRPIKKPSDMEGLKLRTYGAMTSAAIEAAGAAPVLMSSAEVYTALERGVLDGALSGTTTFVIRKWMEVIKYFTNLEWWLGPANPFYVAINTDLWNKMEPAAQEALQKAVDETWEYTRREVKKETETALATLKEKGLPIYHIRVGTPEWKEWYDVCSAPSRAEFLKRTGARGLAVLELLAKAK
jgi:TRAP-type C4-dicarboxylate transport system substrate-binding protein